MENIYYQYDAKLLKQMKSKLLKYHKKYDIIKETMLEYSYDTEFLYVNYDEKNDKYYVDYYDGDITRINTTKQELQEANYKIGDFYVPILDGEFLEEVDYVKDSIKRDVKFKLEELEESAKRGKNEK